MVSNLATNPPKRCPKCQGKVKKFFINLEGDQVVMCEQKTCDWPFRGEGGFLSLQGGKGEKEGKGIGGAEDCEDEKETSETNVVDKGTTRGTGGKLSSKSKKEKETGKETFEKVGVRKTEMADKLLQQVEDKNKKLEKVGRRIEKKMKSGREDFDQVEVRKGNEADGLLRKVERKNKKLEKLGRKKYRPFGQEAEKSRKKVKKAEVPPEEADVIAELLEAVAVDRQLTLAESAEPAGFDADTLLASL